MALIEIPSNADFISLSKNWCEAVARDKTPAEVEIRMSRNSFIKVDGLAYLTAHCLELKNRGSKFKISGDYGRVNYLQRMGFHRILGLDEKNLATNPEIGRFIPISLIRDGDDVAKTVNLICELVIRQFKDGVKFIPAMEWAVNELIDNIVIHAESPVPGVVCAQSYPQTNQLSVAICDMGRGISGSLATTREIESDAIALEQALTRGVTRDPEVGQGNGMAGSLEICRANAGSLSLWSGDAMFNMSNGKEKSTKEIDRVQGTGLCLEMKTDNPVDLRDTWIAGGDWSYIDASAQNLEEKGGINVASECANTGSRPPAKYLRRKVEAVLPQMDTPLALDFSSVKSASSSFLDELLGRLSAKYGTDVFKARIPLSGMTETVRKIANVVIAQRAGEIDNIEESSSDITVDHKEDSNESNAWIIKTELENLQEIYSVTLAYTNTLFSGIDENKGDILLLLDKTGKLTGFAQIYLKSASNETTTFLFKRTELLKNALEPISVGLELSEDLGVATRLSWADFENAYKIALKKPFTELPDFDGRSKSAQRYLRELLQQSVKADLLGPAGGPNEEVAGMSVRDRYLVGKLAPKEEGSIDGNGTTGNSPVESGENEIEDAPVGNPDHISTRDKKNSTYDLSANGEDEDNEENQSEAQSIVPSSLGFTFCVDGATKEIELDASWGRYNRGPSNHLVKDNGDPELTWHRETAGGKILIDVSDSKTALLNPDPSIPEVIVRVIVREKTPNGDRLVSIFLINDQEKPTESQDSAWLFQPELLVRGIDNEAVFRRRPVLGNSGMDEENDTLEMVYRKRVEFAVGHGVAIHAETEPGDPEKSQLIKTVVMPDYEVAVTETPGLDPKDRPVLRELFSKGSFDMISIANAELAELVDTLMAFANDYKAWIIDQQQRIPVEFSNHETAATNAMNECNNIHKRLIEGIETLKTDVNALEAFRFANRAMAMQRTRSIYALAMRRDETARDKINPEDFDKPENRTWRPFQLAFILLSVPSLSNPKHKDRTEPIDAAADLLWFPTGGGKTEAYLGVAAFTMGIRRLQSDYGSLDSSRGLAVIMRYTLRLLTIQQFQRATALLCAMEVIRKSNCDKWGQHPFTLGLWVGNKVTPGTTERSNSAIQNERDGGKPRGSETPAQLTFCPWCGSEISPGRDIKVDTAQGRTFVYCGDKLSKCDFSKLKSGGVGLPINVVDEEIYRRPPSMLIGTVDKFAMMAWRGESRNLFGKANQECMRHGLLLPDSDCNGSHRKRGSLPPVTVKNIKNIRPPDLIIQDEFHLISGPLGTMVGIYESAVDELCSWDYEGEKVRPKIIASTATVRKAKEQIKNVFLREVSIFPPTGLDIEDNFFSVQRSIDEKPGRAYLGICSPGSSRAAVLIRLYVALLTASKSLHENFKDAADPYMTLVGYFNSLRELGGMRRLAEDDVQTRSFRVNMGKTNRPGLAQRSVRVIDELTSRVSSKLIPKKLDQLEIPFREKWGKGDTRSIDVVLATNMLSVGVDINRLGLMAMNGQPKTTAEYIQATSRVGRSYLGLVCTVLTWSRPRDMSHYESFEHYHATFYKHVEAQSVTPFSPRAMDRGMTGVFTSLLRLKDTSLNSNSDAKELKTSSHTEAIVQKEIISERSWKVTDDRNIKEQSENKLNEYIDSWVNEATKPGRTLVYEKKLGTGAGNFYPLLKKPSIENWDKFTAPMSMREVEPAVKLIMNKNTIDESKSPDWKTPTGSSNSGDNG